MRNKALLTLGLAYMLDADIKSMLPKMGLGRTRNSTPKHIGKKQRERYEYRRANGIKGKKIL